MNKLDRYFAPTRRPEQASTSAFATENLRPVPADVQRQFGEGQDYDQADLGGQAGAGC